MFSEGLKFPRDHIGKHDWMAECLILATVSVPCELSRSMAALLWGHSGVRKTSCHFVKCVTEKATNAGQPLMIVILFIEKKGWFEECVEK
ncbi:unnamed protein product [Clavelina lepadiformis]|uniref:Uncharacterized protein n=1 Tax=Clavelina lepadiformis TaxID=159417 RepID=A0ABP0F2C5_CLALP